MPARLLPRRRGKTLLGEDRDGKRHLRDEWETLERVRAGPLMDYTGDLQQLSFPSGECSTLPRHAVGCHREHVRHRRGSDEAHGSLAKEVFVARNPPLSSWIGDVGPLQDQLAYHPDESKLGFLNLRTAEVASLKLIGEPRLDDPGH